MAAGYYEIRSPGAPGEDAYVTVLRNPALAGPDKWIAHAGWDRHLVTDPLPTKREAVRQAEFMLADLMTGAHS